MSSPSSKGRRSAWTFRSICAAPHFQRRVWLALQKLRVGETVSYAEVARRIGSPTAVRAVAGACAANSIAIAIPCHRVVRYDGSVSGYAWGVERKRALIDREAQAGEPAPTAPGDASGRKPEMNAHASTKAMSAEARVAASPSTIGRCEARRGTTASISATVSY